MKTMVFENQGLHTGTEKQGFVPEALIKKTQVLFHYENLGFRHKTQVFQGENSTWRTVAIRLVIVSTSMVLV